MLLYFVRACNVTAFMKGNEWWLFTISCIKSSITVNLSLQSRSLLQCSILRTSSWRKEEKIMFLGRPLPNCITMLLHIGLQKNLYIISPLSSTRVCMSNVGRNPLVKSHSHSIVNVRILTVKSNDFLISSIVLVKWSLSSSSALANDQPSLVHVHPGLIGHMYIRKSSI